MWLENISRLASDSKFHSPATSNDIFEVESALEIYLPKELKDLLQESNGVEGSYDLGLIWDTERIRHDNLTFRQSLHFKDVYMPFDNLMFFADAGNGDRFAFAIVNKEIRNPDVLFGITKMIVENGPRLLLRNIWNGG